MERVVQGFEDVQIGGCPRGPGIGRKTKEDNTDTALCDFGSAQKRQVFDPRSQVIDPFGAGGHRLDGRCRTALQRASVTALWAMTTGEDCGICRAVQLGQGDEHRGLNRAQSLG